MAVSGTYITVELVARVSGDDVVLLDANGKKIGRVPSDLARKPSEKTLASLAFRKQWAASFGGMIKSVHAARARRKRSAWETKTLVWTKSLRLRRNRLRVVKAVSVRFSEVSRPDWNAAVRCLLSQYHNVMLEKRLRKQNPWRLWAQTVAGNHRKKANARKARPDSHCETTGTQAARAEFQVCFDWHGTDASPVIVGSH